MAKRFQQSLVVILITISSLVIIGSFIFIISKDTIISFLTYNKPVNAEQLIVEGWIDDALLDKVADKYKSAHYNKIICVGSLIGSDLEMPTEGLLEYDFREKNVGLQKGDSLKLTVKGTPVNEVFPEFSIFLNDTKVCQFNSTVDWKEYIIILDYSIQISTVGISFDNDEYSLDEDRNFNMKSITLNKKVYPARSNLSFLYRKEDLQKKNPAPTNFHSLAGICAHKLISRGIPGERIEILATGKSNRDKTMNSAITVRKWLDSNKRQNNSINIYSESIHSRRTFVIYQRILRKQGYEIGIISETSDDQRYLGNNLSIKNIIRETSGYLYYRFATPFLRYRNRDK